MVEELKNRINRRKHQHIITSILDLILGILFLVVPNTSGNVLCIIAGWFFIIGGIVCIAFYFSYGPLFGGHALVLGIAMTFAGIFCLCNPEVVQGLLTFIFGVFIIIDGSASVADSIECARAHIAGWPIMLALSLIIVVFGVLSVFGPYNTVMMFIGISLIIDGICGLVLAFKFSRCVHEAKTYMVNHFRNDDPIDVDYKEE